MNFLGHLYLAGSDPQVRLGNFIADHIKGIPITSFPPNVTRGILQHRAIDSFTDTHPALAECRNLIRPAYGKYAGVVLDVLMDFFLANRWDILSPYPYRPFVARFYLQLVRYWRILPPYWQRMLPAFIANNRLCRYRSIEGICESLDIMARTTSLPDASDRLPPIVEAHFETFDRHTLHFINDAVGAMQFQFEIEPIGWAISHSGMATVG